MDNIENKVNQDNEKIIKIQNAFVIGFAVGIIIYSIVQSSWGLFTLIPLYIIYRIINKSKTQKES